MGLLDFIFRPKEKTVEAVQKAPRFQTLTAYQPTWTSFSGHIYESELVRAAVDARARHISKLKVEILGSAQPVLRNKLKHQPNAWQTWSQFLYRTSTILDVTNTCFIVPVMNEYYETVGYTPILPTRCQLKEYNGQTWLQYLFKNNKTAVIETNRVAVLTKFQYEDDFFGASNRALHETMNLIHITNQGIEEATKNSATYRFMARVGNFSNEADLKKERQRFTEANLKGESDNSGLLLFPNKYEDIKQIESKPYTVDEKQMELIRTNVFNYFGVNNDILQNKAYGDSWAAFYEGVVESFSIQFSESMSKAMFTDKERSNGAGIMATSNRLQYMSNADKLAVSSQMADRGLMTINEIRDIWNLPPLEGGDTTIIRGEYKEGNEVSDDE